MNRRMGIWGGLLFVGAWIGCGLAGCGTDTEEPSFLNPYDPVRGDDIPVPDSLGATIGDQRVTLQWRLPDGATVEEYAVFRRIVDGEDAEEHEALLATTAESEFTDHGVRNSRTYAYSVAAGRDGRFGHRTAELEAQPGLYLVRIADEDQLTAERQVAVEFVAPGAVAVQLAEATEALTGVWRPLADVLTWTLSAGDGEKTLYARFRLADGAQTLPVGDSIRLDTRSEIRALAFDGDPVRAPGTTLHVRLDAGEPHGTATVEVSGVLETTVLFDDGSGGDAIAFDGVYERDVMLRAAAEAVDAAVIGRFTDEAGNIAASLTAARLLTVASAPTPVELLAAQLDEPPDAPGVTLQWTLSQEQQFTSYRLFRGATAPVDSSDRLVTTITRSTTLEHQDGDVVEGETYYYRIYVQDRVGLERGSNTLAVAVPNVRPPAAVSLQTPSAMNETAIALEWSMSGDGDFAAYRLYRDEEGAVTSDDTLVAEITDVEQTFYDDTGRRENTRYYYRIYVLDRAGLVARGNEVEATTANAPPPAVTLAAATEVDSSAATLSWSMSDAHDFAAYRLYRDEIPTVTTAATQVAELDDAEFVTFRDTGLTPGRHYYYRVFVVDDAADAALAGSNTISVETTAGGAR